MISPNLLETKTISLFLNINHLLETDDRQASASFPKLMHLPKKMPRKAHLLIWRQKIHLLCLAYKGCSSFRMKHESPPWKPPSPAALRHCPPTASLAALQELVSPVPLVGAATVVTDRPQHWRSWDDSTFPTSTAPPGAADRLGRLQNRDIQQEKQVVFWN